jgi:oligopeptide transport system substrate-binding protein
MGARTIAPRNNDSVRKEGDVALKAITMRIVLLFCLSSAATPFACAAGNTLRAAMSGAETSFDPAAQSEEATLSFTENFFDPLLQYDYLARPAKVVPNTVEAMPLVSDGGKTYTFRIKQGIYFSPDPAFNGVRRELIAADYAYSLKRLFDPKVKSPWLFLLEGKIVGADAAMRSAKADNRFDYDAPIAGIVALDRYTLRLRLEAPDYNLLYILATPATGAVAREVVEAYADDFGSHPVGTGPYRLKEWKRASKIVIEANPDYRTVIFEPSEPGDAADKEIIAAIKGKRIPMIQTIEVYVIEENQPRYLAFLDAEHDYLDFLSPEFVPVAMPDGKLAPSLAARGIRLYPEQSQETWYTFFNMEDPVVGGYSAEKVALRRAIGLAFDIDQELKIIRKGLGVKAQTPIPPGVAGYDPDFRSPTGLYDPARAKALLDTYGYVDRDGDGYRELPDGRALTIEYASPNDSFGRQYDELWQKCLRAIGIRMSVRAGRVPDLRKAARLGKLQMRTDAWRADYPDGENFLQLLYGPNTGQVNYARFQLPEYDRLYEQARNLPDSPERQKLYRRMIGLMLVYAPWKLGIHRQRPALVHPWVLGYKKHPNSAVPWRYLYIDAAIRRRAAQ